jgi:drug/metabolite transporter (DMT)-like permease
MRPVVWIAYAIMCLIWGTTWLVIKIGLHSIGPLTSVGLRFIIAGMLLYIIAALRRELCPLRDLPWKLICTLALFTFAIDYGLIYVAETRLDSGLVAVLFGTLPFFSFGFASVMIGERTTPRTLLGAGVAFVGVAIISLSGAAHGSPLFALATIAAAASAAYANVYAKGFGHVSPLVTLPPSMLLGGAPLFIIGIASEATQWSLALSASSIAALLYLAIVGSGVALFLMLWLLARLSAGVVGLSTLVFPVIAVAVGALFGGERFTGQELIGAAFVIAGMAAALVPQSQGFPRIRTYADADEDEAYDPCGGSDSGLHRNGRGVRSGVPGRPAG